MWFKWHHSFFDLTNVSVHDVRYLNDVKCEYLDCSIFGNRGYISASMLLDLFETAHIKPECPYSHNQKNWRPTIIPFAKARKWIETLFSQMGDQFMIGRNYVKEMTGLFTRIIGKISALTFLQYINYSKNKPIGQLKYAKIYFRQRVYKRINLFFWQLLIKKMKTIMFKRKVFALFALFALMSFIVACHKEDDSPLAVPLWEANQTRNKIITISDIHLGVDDDYSETVTNRQYLEEFLRRLQVTEDVKELVIVGDFLDEWFLPYSYTHKITEENEDQFYKKVIENNQSVIDEFKNVINHGIKVVYVAGNHDMTLKKSILDEAIPGIEQIESNEPQGVNSYYAGSDSKIVIEHGHRYDVFSAPDCVTNEELCGNNNKTILPAGYFYAINAASWVIEGRPSVIKNYPIIETPSNFDQLSVSEKGAFAYYRLIATVSSIHTSSVDANAKMFNMKFAGFNEDYSFMDFYPQQHADGIYATLFKNIQDTWGQRQSLNMVQVPNSFLEALPGALDPSYFHRQAFIQYLNNNSSDVDVVVFGHTHVPDYKEENGKIYVNDGTWVDHNSDGGITRTFAVIQTDGTTKTVKLFSYETTGDLTDITQNAKNDEYINYNK